MAAAIRSSGKEVIKKQPRSEYISKIPLRSWRAWKNWFFYYNNFIGYGWFFAFCSNSMDQKMARAKKVAMMKNQFFHSRQPRKGIFEIHLLLGCFFMTSFPELLMAATIPGVEIFCWKSAWVVFFYIQNWNFWGALESERTGFALMSVYSAYKIFAV